jgi:hypothetical protein
MLPYWLVMEIENLQRWKYTAKCNITTGLFGLIGIGQTGRNFFSAEDYTNMSYYNCCGIRPEYSNISKRGEGVTICVVLRSKSPV